MFHFIYFKLLAYLKKCFVYSLAHFLSPILFTSYSSIRKMEVFIGPFNFMVAMVRLVRLHALN